jgi:hypothetical protein
VDVHTEKVQRLDVTVHQAIRMQEGNTGCGITGQFQLPSNGQAMNNRLGRVNTPIFGQDIEHRLVRFGSVFKVIAGEKSPFWFCQHVFIYDQSYRKEDV